MISDDTPSRRERKMRLIFEAFSGGTGSPESAEAQQKPLPTRAGSALTEQIINILSQQDRPKSPEA